MEYTSEQISQVEKMASIYLPISDMAIILGLPVERLKFDIQMKDTEISQAYQRGKASSKVKLRAQEMQLALVGSPLALATVQQNFMDMEDDE